MYRAVHLLLSIERNTSDFECSIKSVGCFLIVKINRISGVFMKNSEPNKIESKLDIHTGSKEPLANWS